jgi:hypothetical protein
LIGTATLSNAMLSEIAPTITFRVNEEMALVTCDQSHPFLMKRLL